MLLIPIILFIDTATNQYYIHLKGLAKVSIEGHKEELIKIKLKIFFLNFYFYPLRGKINSGKKKKHQKKDIKKSSKKINIKTGLRVLKSFKVKRLFLDIDTGNCIINAKLYPLFAFLNYKIGDFNINFEGRNKMMLYIQNRPLYIIKSFINI